jgi:hypothetical protein
MSRARQSVIIAAIACLLCSGTVLAARALVEPDAIKVIPRLVPAAKIQKGLQDAGLGEKCSAAALKTPELVGLQCRLAVHRSLAAELPPDSPTSTERRIVFARDAAVAATAIAAYAPLSKKPGFGREQFDAHQQACSVVVDAYDALKSVPASAPADLRLVVDKGLAGQGGLFDAACNCTQSAVRLADGANASLDEKGALQAQLTSRGCFLDKSKIRAERGGPESSFTGEATRIAAANSVEARLLEYAQTRAVGLERCKDKGFEGVRLVDRGKLKNCVCGEISRFSFPKEKDRADVTITLPLRGADLGVEVVITAAGKVSTCGPLVGPLAERT